MIHRTRRFPMTQVSALAAVALLAGLAACGGSGGSGDEAERVVRDYIGAVSDEVDGQWFIGLEDFATTWSKGQCP